MHIIVNQTVLQEAVAQAAKAVSTRTTIPILTGIKLSVFDHEITLIGSDSELSIQASIPIQVDQVPLFEVKQKGQIVLPARYFSEIVKKLPDEKVEIEVTDQLMTSIRSGSVQYQLNGLNAAEYPQLPNIEETNVVKISSDILKKMIRQTVFAVSTQESRPVLTGILWSFHEDQLTFTATDSHRLAKRSTSIDGINNGSFAHAIIPGKSLNELQRILDDGQELIDLVVTEHQLMVKTEHIIFYTRLLEGTYPDTERIIPKESKVDLTIATRALLQAIERASLLGKDGKHIIKLTTMDNELEITSSAPEIGRVTEKVTVLSKRGEDVEIAFNSRYLQEALRAIDADQIKIEITGGMSPFMMKPIDDEQTLHLVLPVRTT